jgi:hypothetical protein
MSETKFHTHTETQAKLYKTPLTFYWNALGVCMSVVSEKLPSCLYTLKTKSQANKAFPSFHVHIQTRNRTPFVLYLFLFKKNFTCSLSFDIGHGIQSSKQSTRMVRSVLYFFLLHNSHSRFICSSYIFQTYTRA